MRVAPRTGAAACLAVLALGVLVLGAGCAPLLVPLPRLVAAWPAPGVTLSRGPHELLLTFNRALAAESTTVRLTRAADDWQPATAVALDDNQADLQLAERLAPGDYTVQWHAVGARAGGVADGEYGFVVSGEPGPDPQLSVSESDTDAGQVIEVRGQGWAARQDVQLQMGDEDLPLGSATADKHGNFSVNARVPRQVAFGVQPVIATDDQAHRALAAVRVHWGGWPPLLAWTTGSRGPEPGEVSFSMTLRNRSDYLLEAVQVDLPDPPGASVVAVDGGGHYTDGHLVWAIPSLDRGQAGPLRVVYRATAPVATHATIHFRHRRPHDCRGDECLTAFVSETTSDSTPVAP